jgi:hypothetical protein
MRLKGAMTAAAINDEGSNKNDCGQPKPAGLQAVLAGAVTEITSLLKDVPEHVRLVELAHEPACINCAL